MEKQSLRFSDIFFAESVCLFLLAGIAWLLNVGVYQNLSAFASICAIAAIIFAPFEIYFAKPDEKPSRRRRVHIHHH